MGNLNRKYSSAYVSFLRVVIGCATLLLFCPTSASAASKCSPAPKKNLIGCDFSNLDLRGKSFANSNLTNAIFTNANLTRVNFDGAILAGVKSGAIIGTPAKLPTGWKLVSGWLLGTKVRLVNANLSGANLANVNFSGSSLVNANLTNANLTNANLTNANLAGANIGNANFTKATLKNITSGAIVGTPAHLPTGYALEEGGYFLGPNVNLYEVPVHIPNAQVSLNGANLVGAEISGNLVGMHFEGANMASVRLHNANLSGVHLKNANLSGVDFTGANLTGADLTGANLSRAKLLRVKWIDVKLNGVNVEGADMSFATPRWSDDSIRRNAYNNYSSGRVIGTPIGLPANWQLIHGYFIGPNANLSGANLDKFLLAKTNISGLISGKITGKPSSLPAGWKLTAGYLVGPKANLANANLFKANLAGADLTGAVMNGVRSGSVTGTPIAFPLGWKLVHGFLLGLGASLEGANFQGLDFSAEDFSSYLLHSGGIKGVPKALPPNWHLRGGYLVGPQADLRNVNLARLNLSNVDFSDSVMTGANLTGANLANSSLHGVWLDQVKLTGANVSGSNLAWLASTAGTVSGGLTGVPASLCEACTVKNGYLLAPGVNLKGANLTGSDLTGVNLQNATLTQTILTKTNLSSADLTRATLDGVTSGQILGTPIGLPFGFVLGNGFLIGHAANLAGADLKNLDLSKAYFDSANVDGAEFLGSTLTHDSQLMNLSGIPVNLPASWHIVDHTLVGPGAVFSGMKVSGIDMSGWDLSNAYLAWSTFENCNLSGANLSNANLQDAVINGSNVSGTNFTNSIFDSLSHEEALVTSGLTGSPLALPIGWTSVSGTFSRH